MFLNFVYEVADLVYLQLKMLIIHETCPVLNWKVYFEKCTFFPEGTYYFSASTKFCILTVLKSLQIDGLIWLKNFASMFMSLFDSITSTIDLGRVISDSRRRCSLRELSYVPQKNHILYWRVMESFRFTFRIKFFHFCNEIMEICTFILSICKKLMTKYSEVFYWVAVFKELL